MKLKAGDTFICTDNKNNSGPYVILSVTARTVEYDVNGLLLERTLLMWQSWIRDGRMIPATELMKALL
jgi:hypothetical protein